jgi:transcriptional regulator with XRE-family HTH domain
MKYLTTKEKITFLNNYPVEKIDELTYIVKDGVIDEQEKRIRVRKDFRAEVKAKIAEAGITQTQLAKRLGIRLQNLNNFLNGHIPLRFEIIEELMWILEDNNILVEDENEDIKVIKNDTWNGR